MRVCLAILASSPPAPTCGETSKYFHSVASKPVAPSCYAFLMERKIGIVLSGGGGNGAYQVGVWKYLAERIGVFSGTSVGALNAALFATVPLERAERIWTEGVEGRILLPQKKSGQIIGELISDAASGFADGIFRSAGRLAGSGVWSWEGLLEIMRNVPLERLSAGGAIPAVYATCFALSPPLGTRHFRLNGRDARNIHRILLATSAIPLAFRPERIGGVLYCDGGVSCNVPFAPLLRERCTHALVVSLSPNDVICGNIPPEMRVACIRPSVPFSRLGVLDFSCGRILKLISLGYADCKRALNGSGDNLLLR